MRKLISTAIAAVMLLSLAACSPKGQECKEEGAHMYTSKYGNFVCRKGGLTNGLRWEEV